MQNNQLQSSLDALQRSLGLSSDLEDSSGDADVLGAIGDAYTDLGDLEKAAEVVSLSTCLHAASAIQGVAVVDYLPMLNRLCGVNVFVELVHTPYASKRVIAF